MELRQEIPADYSAVERLIEEAFRGIELSDGLEADLVRRLREAEGFVPALSLVAAIGREIVGHILFTPVVIESDNGATRPSLALAPLAVLPERQRQGIGSALIRHGHGVATRCGFTSIILLGHPKYYVRFGYEPASRWKIEASFKAPKDAFMALALEPGALRGAAGVVFYPPEFRIR